jgi:integrase
LVTDIRPDHLREFRKYLQQRGCTRHRKDNQSWKPLQPKTLRNYLSAVAFFLTWAGKRYGFIPPAIDPVPLPKSKPFRYWKLEDCADLLRAASEIMVNGQPYSCFLGYLFMTGMRKTEAAVSKWEWVDLDERVIRVPGFDEETGLRVTKSGTWRNIPISDSLLSLMENWPTPKRGRLFMMSARSGHLDDNLERTIRRANKRRQAEGRSLIPRLTLHATRHTFAVQSLQAGTSLAAIAQILGHASMDTTVKHYLTLANPDLHAQVKKASAYHNILSQVLSQRTSSDEDS